MTKSLFEHLPEEEVGLIREYINLYGGIAEHTELQISCTMDYLLRFWSANKAKFFQMFNEQFIYKFDVDLEDNYTEKLTKYQLSDLFYHHFHNNWKNTITATFNEENTAYRSLYPNKFKFFDARDKLLLFTSQENLINNTNPYEDFDVYLPSGQMLKIRKGCKLMRVFKKLSDAFNITGFESFRITHSMLINSFTTKGKVCLSIHPLDFLTMSDNANNWDSCMSWVKEGVYRLGTVEMMNSPCVIVAYLESDTKALTFGEYAHSWNSKIWRSLYIVTPQIITSVRHYPDDRHSLDATIIAKLKELSSESYYDTPFDMEANQKVELPNGAHVAFEFNTRLMYNDMCHTAIYTIHKAYISDKIPANSDIHIDIMYSGETECMECGKEDACYDDLAYRVKLNCCYEPERCARCGCEITHREDEDNSYYANGTVYCCDCADYLDLDYCSLCADCCLPEDLITITLSYDNAGDNCIPYERRCCKDCFEDSEYIYHILHFHVKDLVKDPYTANQYYLQLSKCTTRTLDAFYVFDPNFYNDCCQYIQQEETNESK